MLLNKTAVCVHVCIQTARKLLIKGHCMSFIMEIKLQQSRHLCGDNDSFHNDLWQIRIKIVLRQCKGVISKELGHSEYLCLTPEGPVKPVFLRVRISGTRIFPVRKQLICLGFHYLIVVLPIRKLTLNVAYVFLYVALLHTKRFKVTSHEMNWFCFENVSNLTLLFKAVHITVLFRFC